MTAGRVIACEPNPTCADPHLYRWHCLRGLTIDNKRGTPGVCPLRKCAPSNPPADLRDGAR